MKEINKVTNSEGRTIAVGDYVEFNGMRLEVREIDAEGRLLVDNGVDSWWISTKNSAYKPIPMLPNEPKEHIGVSFQDVTRQMSETYIRKNHDYGNSFDKSLDKYSEIAALTRISDKFNRIENLFLNGGQKVSDESLNDTILDMANYCVMWYVYRMGRQNNVAR